MDSVSIKGFSIKIRTNAAKGISGICSSPSIRLMSADEPFHSTLQAHLLIAGILVVADQDIGGLWTANMFGLY
ncbi:MAG: hypothetical protein ACYDER_13790 [Ktedonobacteraceae bacterium]